MNQNAKIYAVLGDISVFLSLIAAIPYELGGAAEILPPAWKEKIAGVSAFAYFALRIIQRYTESKPLPPEGNG